MQYALVVDVHTIHKDKIENSVFFKQKQRCANLCACAHIITTSSFLEGKLYLGFQELAVQELNT
jgi:hypothetical protein